MLYVCRQVMLDIFRQKMVPADRSGQRLSGEHPAVPIFTSGSELIGNNLTNLVDARDPAHPE